MVTKNWALIAGIVASTALPSACSSDPERTGNEDLDEEAAGGMGGVGISPSGGMESVAGFGPGGMMLPPGGAFGTGGMTAGAGGGAVSAGGAPIAPGGGPPPDKLPPVSGVCPALTSGSASVAGTAVQLWVGTKPGPLYFYWHATGQQYTEVSRGMPGATDAVATDGGIVASFATTNGRGVNTGNGVWFTGDFEAADQILACGIQAGLVDTSRIYTAGYSAGGLQACAMVAQRGRYLAAAICYSGGAGIIRGTPQDTSNLPPTLLLHGAAGSDVIIIDFNAASASWATAYAAAGGLAIDCDDGGDHIVSAFTRMGFGGRAMPFLKAHAYGSPSPHAAGLPGDWPSYCEIVR